MKKIITYGTYDLLHQGHINLLRRAKELGDYLIVGVTSDSFDKGRGKLNVRNNVLERVEAVRKTGYADEIIIEDYLGQKIDDIQKYDVDIFAIGSDWVGKFDYLNKYCKVIYLDRTKGISSSQLRSEEKLVRMGIIGDSAIACKYLKESGFVNGLEVSGIFSPSKKLAKKDFDTPVFDMVEALYTVSDAVYIVSGPGSHAEIVRQTLERGKHVLVESPIAMTPKETWELVSLARRKKLLLMDAIKTKYATAFNRLVLLAESGKIGDIISVQSTCTSLRDYLLGNDCDWNSICAWGPTAFLPVLKLLGPKWKSLRINSLMDPEKPEFDLFTKLDFVYDKAVATVSVGKGVKSEGELIVSGTKGYIYVPAPWWKTDYFEIRYENPEDNRRYYYQLEGEGIRYMLVEFVNLINGSETMSDVDIAEAKAVSRIIATFNSRKGIINRRDS